MPIDSVIIPVDFSEASIAAIGVGRSLAARAAAPVELVSVTSGHYENTTAAALRSLAAEQGAGLAHRVLTIDDDDIEARLVAEVLARPSALWCVGSHGRTALGELLFGSVSADLVRDAEAPILVVGPRAEDRTAADVVAVALDGSEHGEMIMPAVVQLAAALGLRVRLLEVGRAHVEADINETAYVARVAARFDATGGIDYDVLVGDSEDELVGYVERSDDVVMLAMATRGVPAGARLSVPSTALRVLRRATVPVLMLHPPLPEATVSSAPVRGELPLADLRQRVVVGVDSLAASRPAIDWAAEEAARRGAILQVLHTWQIPVGPGSMYGYPIWPDIEACRQGALEEAAAVVAAVAEARPELIIETIVAEGGAASALATHSLGAEMVVLGRHHHGRLAGLLLGSVSESAVHRVDCPLVVIPCDEPS